jgi:predicted small secreted protein
MNRYRLFLLGAFALVAGCSTVAGIGTDLKNASDWTHDKVFKPSVPLNK